MPRRPDAGVTCTASVWSRSDPGSVVVNESDETTADSYCPFVRLALARYLPRSLTGCALSTPVTTDFVQLLLRRTPMRPHRRPRRPTNPGATWTTH
jgi:hypothetical protein